MDYRRVAGPFIHHSDNDNEEHRFLSGSDTAGVIKDEYNDIEKQYQRTESTDVNFLEIAERLLGRRDMVTLQQINEELKNEEVNHFMQFKESNLSMKSDTEDDENEQASSPESSTGSIEDDVQMVGRLDQVNSSKTACQPNPSTFVVSFSTDKASSRIRDDMSSEKNELTDHGIENLIPDSESKVCDMELESKQQIDQENSKDSIVENHFYPVGDDSSNNIDETSEVEKEIEKSLDNVSVKYDKESQTYICVRMAKAKDKNQLVYKVNANQTDSCISARELPYKCKFCEEAFSLFSQLKRHIMLHSLDSPFTCKTCGRVYRNDGELKKHAKKHDRAKPHICVECGKSFRQLHMLQNHARTHNGEKPFLCDTCGQGFGQKENLKLHERCHSDLKPHKCAVCGKQFNNTKCLHRHELTHSNERNYPCDVCGKSFLRNDHLRRHKRTHGEEPKYKCTYCGKGFHQKVNTEEHERIHTGDKPFVCEVCGKGFTQRGNLKSHLIKHSFV
jgi:hypothetical protein